MNIINLKIRPLSIFFLFSISFVNAAPAPPLQPETGPGGKDYRYDKVVSSFYVPENNYNYQFWIFEPAIENKDTLPVIVFIHGWSAISPSPYIDFINHIVKRGNIVIFPGYQENVFTPSQFFTGNLIISMNYALEELNNGDHQIPDYDKFAITGHSMGGVLSANLANRCAENNFPEPKAIICQEPGDGNNNVLDKDLSGIPSTALLLCIVGEEDEVVGSIDADSIYNEVEQIPLKNRDFVVLRSDRYGEPDLVANHSAPTGSSLDAMDFYCFWKLVDALTDAAFYNKNREYALGNTEKQRFMGLWSDGTPVKELYIRPEDDTAYIRNVPVLKNYISKIYFCKEDLTINEKLPISKVELFNNTGQQISNTNYSIIFSHSRTIIKINRLSKGVYFLFIDSCSKKTLLKIIKVE